jgi:hypothetical protein
MSIKKVSHVNRFEIQPEESTKTDIATGPVQTNPFVVHNLFS